MATEPSCLAQRNNYVVMEDGKYLRGTHAAVPVPLYHYTSLTNGLSILSMGSLMNSDTCHLDGVFTCKDKGAAFYDRGALVHLRSMGCLASVKTSAALDWSRPLPAGMVVQAKRSAHEYILDAASTEIFKKKGIVL